MYHRIWKLEGIQNIPHSIKVTQYTDITEHLLKLRGIGTAHQLSMTFVAFRNYLLSEDRFEDIPMTIREIEH